MLSATQGLAKLSFFKYVDFEMMDHNNRAGAYEWGLQTLNISIEVCATWSNHSEKCTKWKYIKKAAGMKENKQRNIDKTLCGLGKIYSCCIWIISYIFMHVYIYIQYTGRFLTSSFPRFEGRGSELAPFPCKSGSPAPQLLQALGEPAHPGRCCEEITTPAPIQGCGEAHVSCSTHEGPLERSILSFIRLIFCMLLYGTPQWFQDQAGRNHLHHAYTRVFTSLSLSSKNNLTTESWRIRIKQILRLKTHCPSAQLPDPQRVPVAQLG